MRELRIAFGEARNRRRANVVVIQRIDAVDNQHGAQRGDKRRYVQHGYDDAVHQANHRANGGHQQNHQRNRHFAQVGEYFVHIIRCLQQRGRNHRRQPHLPPHR